MVNYQHRADRAVVQFSGELTHEAAVELVDTVDMLVRVYFYSLIELIIASLGGASSALEHYLHALRRWRVSGVRVRTRVVERAASAAALMASLGDERIAEPGASLLYHLFRLPSNAPVTASAAALIFADLTRLDEQYVGRLVDRAMADADGAATVSVDVEPSDCQLLRLLTADLPSGAKGPLPSLVPGECYAALADGRFERRQLDPVLLAVHERTPARGRSRGGRPSRATRVRPGSES